MSNVHLIGIGGAGLSAIATVLLQQNYTVSGSDMQASAATDRLARLGAEIAIGHRAENLPDKLDAVIISSAIPAHNPELIRATERNLPVMKRAEWLGHMMQDRLGVAIAGTHGKTTTTALTAFLLDRMDQDPTYIVGGFIPQLETNAAAGQGQTFVIEADEYDYTFLGLRPQIAVITIAEWDHPDIFLTPVSLEAAFAKFARLVPEEGLLIGCGDAPGVRPILAQAPAPAVTYGLQPGNDWQAREARPNRRGGYDFLAAGPRQEVPVSLAIPGLHNVCNSLAVLVIADRLGLDLARAARIIGRFRGVGRRFELKGEIGGITIIDDYAHHPTEIRATLAAARARYGERPIWAVFQPHTFSRTLSLLDAFAGAFAGADHVLIVDIFPSREKDEGLIHSRDLVSRMDHPDVCYIGSLRQAADYLAAHLSPPGVLLTMGAGDSYRVGEWARDELRR